jgi:hypothetical protein
MGTTNPALYGNCLFIQSTAQDAGRQVARPLRDVDVNIRCLKFSLSFWLSAPHSIAARGFLFVPDRSCFLIANDDVAEAEKHDPVPIRSKVSSLFPVGNALTLGGRETGKKQQKVT